VIGALRLPNGASVDAAVLSDLEIASFDPSSNQGLLLATLGPSGEVIELSVSFDGRAPRTRAALAPTDVLRAHPQEQVVATLVGRGRDARVARHGGRLFAALRTVEASSGGFLGSSQLPLALYERETSGAWRPVLAHGPTPHVAAGYTLWSDGRVLRVATLGGKTPSAESAPELVARTLAMDTNGGARWTEDVVRRSVDPQRVAGAHRLEAMVSGAEARLALIGAEGSCDEIVLRR
jgi:hypothetical protein